MPKAMAASVPPPSPALAKAPAAKPPQGKGKGKGKQNQNPIPKAKAVPSTITICSSEADFKALRTALRKIKVKHTSQEVEQKQGENGSTNANGIAHNVGSDPMRNLPFFISLHSTSDGSTLLASTILFETVWTVLDFMKLPVSCLKEIFDFVSESRSVSLIVESSAILSMVNYNLTLKSVPPIVKIPSLCDMQLGHELLDNTFAPTLLETAAMLGVSLASSNIQPWYGAMLNEAQLRKLALYTQDLRKMLPLLQARLSKPQLHNWLAASVAVARRLAAGATLAKSADLLAHNAIGFHRATLAMGSHDLLQLAKLAADTSVGMRNGRKEVDELLSRLPLQWRTVISEAIVDRLIDVQMDLGRPAFAFFHGLPRLMLSADRNDVVTDDILAATVNTVADGVDGDNRSGIEGTLHRVSILRGRGRRVVGATLRVGRHIYGVAGILYDVLLSQRHVTHSVLLLGAPGSGKTTMGRDVARLLGEQHRVIIVDSSDEMGGPGLIPHMAIGDARRLSVASGKRGLADALLEAVENHTPDAIIVDELSDRAEVSGASTARQRGVRLLGSAHGNLLSIVKNLALRPLVGGVERVTVSDANCKDNLASKVRNVRAGDAVFDVVVEMGIMEGDNTALRIVHDVNEAVDAIVAGQPYKGELRWRGTDHQIFSRQVTVTP